MSDKPNWVGMGEYIKGTALKPIGSLRKHNKGKGCWVGTMTIDGEERAIVIWEAVSRPDDWQPGMEEEPCLTLFENPGATLLMKDGEEE